MLASSNALKSSAMYIGYLILKEIKKHTEKDTASRNFLYALSNYWNLYYMLRSMTLYDFARHSEISVDYKKLEN